MLEKVLDADIGLDVNTFDFAGKTALQLAVSGQHVQCVELLLRNEDVSVDMYAEAPGGWAATHYAASSGNQEVLQLLLEKRANPNLKTRSTASESPLHVAARYRRRGAYQILLRAGADPLAQNDKRQTPAKLAPSFSKFAVELADGLEGLSLGLHAASGESVPRSTCSSSSGARRSTIRVERVQGGHLGSLIQDLPPELDVPAPHRTHFGSLSQFVLGNISHSGALQQAILGDLSRIDEDSSTVATKTSAGTQVRSTPGEMTAPDIGPTVEEPGSECHSPQNALRGIVLRAVALCTEPRRGDKVTTEIIDADQTPAADMFTHVQELGQGAFGTVFQVQALVSRGLISKGSFYAVKQLSKAKYENQEIVEYAFNERNIMKVVVHPCLIRLFAAYQVERPSPSWALVMEYAAGGTLQKKLEHLGSPGLPLDDCRRYACEMLLGLEYLHDMNVIFRDLKPENVLLSDKDHCKIADFGLAKVLYSSGATATQCGTREFLAPEVGAGPYTQSVDIFSWGVTVFIIMSGGIRRKFPFGEDISFQPFATYAQLRDAVETLRGPQPRCNTAYWNDSFIGLVLPPEALDLVNKTTSMCPQQRGTATQLRTHPFFTGTDFSEVLQACAKDTGWDDVGRVAPLQPGRLSWGRSWDI